ncbi:MAG TPA: sugar phosphate isomerase/epimerase [Caldilineae bacterium]|nr:sugar phosphate isomerase/epimerase [Caldilineae bacterium]
MSRVSLAGWSLVRRFQREQQPLSLLEFPRVAWEEFGIDQIELNEPFFERQDNVYLNRLRAAANSYGVRMLNIAIDRQGDLGAPDRLERMRAVANHTRWFEIAAALGCNAIRANMGGHHDPDVSGRIERLIDSFGRLAEVGGQIGVKILIENHGGVSADPDHILRVIRAVSSPWIGTLPDFGNFPPEVDRYRALEKLAPHAAAVHVKVFEFDASGNDPNIDIPRCIQIMEQAGYTGAYGIEIGRGLDDHEGVLKTKALIERFLI